MVPFSALVQRNALFRDFLLASNISLLGTNIFDITIPLYVLEKTHSAMDLALVSLALSLPYFLMAPLTGYCIDHFDKRRVMLASDLGQVVCMLLLFAYDLMSTQSIWPVFLFVFAAKTLTNWFETVTTFQLIPSLVRKEDLAEANTWFLTLYRLIQVVGPLAGGILMAFLGFRSCIFLNAVSFGATLYFIYKMKNLSEFIDGPDFRRKIKPLSVKSIYENFMESVSYIWRSPIFKPFVLLMFLWNLSSLGPNTPSLTYYLKEFKTFSSAEYGSMVALISFTGVVGFLWSHALYKQFDFYRTLVGAAFWQALLATFAISFFHHPVVLVVVFALSRIGASVLAMGTFLIRQTEIPKSHAGGVNACLRMFFMSAVPISAVGQGLLISKFGVDASFLLGALCLWGAFALARTVSITYEENKKPGARAA